MRSIRNDEYSFDLSTIKGLKAELADCQRRLNLGHRGLIKELQDLEQKLSEAGWWVGYFYSITKDQTTLMWSLSHDLYKCEPRLRDCKERLSTCQQRRDGLVEALEKHRNDAVITCPHHCLCWDVEEALDAVELTDEI